MTRKQMVEFFERLEGPDGCDFKRDKDGKVTWKCDGGESHKIAKEILSGMGITRKKQKDFLSECRAHGGYCDCEILFNAMRVLLK